MPVPRRPLPKKASVKKSAATKASAKKASAKKARTVESFFTVTLPLTEEVCSDLLTPQQQLVVFKAESRFLKVKDLEQGNNKQLKKINNLTRRLQQKHSAEDADVNRCQAFLRAVSQAYSAASQPMMKLAVSFIYWAIEVR